MYKKICALFLLTALSTTPLSALDNSSAAGISLGIGALVGILSGYNTPEIAHHNSFDRVHFSSSRPYSRVSVSTRISSKIAVGLTSGLLTAGLTYWILYHSFVNAGTCKLCGDRVNSWTHFYDPEVKANCGHQFRQNCIKRFMAQNGDRCPTCGVNIYNLFSTVQHVVVSHSYTPFYTPAVVTPVYTPVVVDPILDVQVHI